MLLIYAIQKLNSSRVPGMSPMVAAVVGFVLGESFTDPAIPKAGIMPGTSV